MKASQRRTLKNPRNPGGSRPARKPRDLRDLPDSFVSAPSLNLRACKNCGDERDVEDYVFVNRYGRRSPQKFAWCSPCREQVTEARCARCERNLPSASFYVHPSRSCGLSSYCIACSTESSKASVEKYREMRQRLSDAHPVPIEGDKKGQCLAYLNVGSFTRARVRCTRPAVTANRCLIHASSEERQMGTRLRTLLSGVDSFGSQRWREQHERHLAWQLDNAPDELKELVEDQAKDARFYNAGLPWQVSLNAPIGDDGATRMDFLDHSGQLHIGARHTPDFAEAVCAVIDYRREIDQWAEEAA